MPFCHSNQRSSDKGVPIPSPNLPPQYGYNEFMTNLFLIAYFIYDIQTNINLEVMKYLGLLSLFCLPLACKASILIDSPNSDYCCSLKQNFLLGNLLKRISCKISLIQEFGFKFAYSSIFLTLPKSVLRHNSLVPWSRVQIIVVTCWIFSEGYLKKGCIRR